MVRHAATEPTTTTTNSASASAASAAANAKTPTMPKDADGHGAPSLASGGTTAETDRSACRPEHGFHAFDALYCAVTYATPIKPLFPDDK